MRLHSRRVPLAVSLAFVGIVHGRCIVLALAHQTCTLLRDVGSLDQT